MVTLTRPLYRDWPISCGFQCHLDRTPPSNAPGTDWACPELTPVYAAIGGRTSGCVYRTGGGRSIWITSFDKQMMVYYAHLEWLCALGQEDVYRGQLVGFSGNTGHSTGPHLHFSVKVRGEWVDPLPLLP